MNVNVAILESHLFKFANDIYGAPLSEKFLILYIAQLNRPRFIHSKTAVTRPVPIERALKTGIISILSVVGVPTLISMPAPAEQCLQFQL